MDTAKVADVVFTHGGQPRELGGLLRMPRDGRRAWAGRYDLAPLACIPTTAGTG